MPNPNDQYRLPNNFFFENQLREEEGMRKLTEQLSHMGCPVNSSHLFSSEIGFTPSPLSQHVRELEADTVFKLESAMPRPIDRVQRPILTERNKIGELA